MNTAKQWNIDRSRMFRESLPPVRYLTNTYYQIWLDGLERLLLDCKLVTPRELQTGLVHDASATNVRAINADLMPAALRKGWPSERDTCRGAKFSIGDHVRTVNFQPLTHTRLPRYCRDKVGIITALHGMHVFPDRNALGFDEPQWLYTVEFEATEIWGADTTASAICLNCWEPYLLHENKGER